jgi:cyclopropane fatty-acyl-phospholipid synthase-like methyltransferase
VVIYNDNMSSRAVKLDEAHFRLAEEKARALGTTPDDFVSRLIDTEDALDQPYFDELLAPVREGFEHLKDDQLGALFADARKRSASRNL